MNYTYDQLSKFSSNLEKSKYSSNEILQNIKEQIDIFYEDNIKTNEDKQESLFNAYENKDIEEIAKIKKVDYNDLQEELSQIEDTDEQNELLETKIEDFIFDSSYRPASIGYKTKEMGQLNESIQSYIQFVVKNKKNINEQAINEAIEQLANQKPTVIKAYASTNVKSNDNKNTIK